MDKYQDEIAKIIANQASENSAKTLQSDRNLVTKHTLHDGTEIVIKAFKIPNLINKIAYRYFRKSKAKRSFEYASKLSELGIGTPKPIQYIENFNWLGLRTSYYISSFVSYELTYRELTTDFDIADHDAILRAFTKFTYSLHQKQINFLDHSPGNTLINRSAKGYDFYLVDLNRMEFEPMDFETRIKNFAKLTIHRSMIEIMSDEYAKCTGESYDTIFNMMWNFTQEFQNRYHRKRRLKNKILFWRKKKA
ncbi:Kdo domain containing protein [uncultured Psychroserpens sp.]|uniref:Kdo domain containing protein n=1 Tax=uncultured Psychroserpens sp. TaxID=255436 RepID=UPI002609A9A2|nr:Kdo domain containing protein [uncultured Psychroserpens sp.]